MVFALFLPGAVAYANSNVLWDSYEVPSTRQKDRLLDAADLLTDDEETALLSALDEISQRRRSNVAILTVYSHNGTIQAYADDYFDYNGFGADYNDSGILFMLSMEEREFAISTSGSAISVFTDYGQAQITDRMLPYLSNGNYYEAFQTFINLADNYYESYENGSPVDYNNQYKEPANIPQNILISVLIGLIVAIFPILIMKSSLDTVKMNKGAANYRSHNGINMQVHRDRFINKTISKRPIPQESSSRSGGHGGGSSIHISSSGHSHGGSHGHF